jgi:hypothetical protein
MTIVIVAYFGQHTTRSTAYSLDAAMAIVREFLRDHALKVEIIQ